MPLTGNNLRGDMASCVGKGFHPLFGHEYEQGDDEDDNHGSDRIRIIPNPVKENGILVSINAEESARVQIQIMSSTGNTVQTKTIFVEQGANQLSVDISTLNKGLYTVVLTYPTGKITATKFIRL